MHACVCRTVPVVITTVVLVSFSTTAQDRADSTSLPDRFTAVAISGGGPRSDPLTQVLELTVNRWSTEAERRRLIEAMAKGQDELLETLRDQRPVGTIQAPGRLAWDLRYAHQVALADGGRRIFLATDRPIAIWEAINRPRTIDYPFTFIRLHMKGDGVGEGKMSLATRVIVDEEDDGVEFEQYTANPIQLNEVRQRE